MNALELIGAVGAAAIREAVANVREDDGIARYMLDRLTAEQVAAIIKSLSSDQHIRKKISIKVPRKWLANYDLPDDVLTDERSVNLRHTQWTTPALLLANTDDDQGTSLQEVTRLGAKLLTTQPHLWVSVASLDLNLLPETLDVWRECLTGLNRAGDWSLQQMAGYVALTRQRIADEGKPLLDALGWALPKLFLPRDSGYFRAMRERDQLLPNKWKKLYEKMIDDRGPLLNKQRRSGQLIESEELAAQWKKVLDDIPAAAHSAIEAFIAAPPSWNSASEGLTQFEFEEDNINLLFSGLNQKKLTLAEETLDYFEFNHPKRLTENEKDYLEQLKKIKARTGREEDQAFFEDHRGDFEQDKSLRAKWEKFVFGKPIECDDLLAGLLLAIDRLYGQTTNQNGPRTLEIRSSRQTKAQWLELNADIGIAFCMKYRGLPALMGEKVIWDTPYIFQYDALLEQAQSKKKYRRNESTARNSIQIKFDIALSVAQGATRERSTVQVIWNGRPNAIGIELSEDLQRLQKRPFVMSSVVRQSVSRKGALQAVSLADVTTIEPAFGKDAGSLVPKIGGSKDLAKLFPDALRACVASGRVSASQSSQIDGAWSKFKEEYSATLKEWSEIGLASELLIHQAGGYQNLLDVIMRNAPGDVNRRELLQPVLGIGCVSILGGAPSALVAPWHPLRLMAMALKARAVAGLVRHVLDAEDVNFGDRRLFFSDLRNELEHPWYPEVAVGYAGGEPLLLSESGTLNDYSLMERPVSNPAETVTDVDPKEAARQIRQLIERYLDLQPHESSNLSIMLYNCDAAGLPIEAVSALGSLSEGNEVHCNVLVRHRERKKLGHVYGDLLERAEIDPDALSVSEASRNFMSKLRIGVMLDTDNKGHSKQQREVDVAFLHDVVARQAKEAWFVVSDESEELDMSEHVPARWSYRRVTPEAELKAASFLVCPRQPKAGWAYLDAVASVVRQEAPEENRHVLPARQISFEDQHLRSMFDEVHSFAEWVATYDELLDKRQLRAQKVNVIRYRRQRTRGRNMVVSSTSELRILGVLVRKRLSELNLGLPDDKVAALAQRMIDDALVISGDIVLRAAKRGVSAGELIGLVLSRALVAEEIGSSSAVAWFLLDDYAEWLGQKEEGIADILGLSVDNDEQGNFRLRVIITEAKYIGADGCAEARRTSQQQLRQTVSRMEDALFGDPGRLDRDLWLSRIADLLLDGNTPLGQPKMLEAVRDGIRHGKVPIDLRGYSHVFVAHPADGGGVLGAQECLDDIPNGLQETFGRQELRSLVLAYEKHMSFKETRNALGRERPWEHKTFRLPAPRVSWTVKVGDRKEKDDVGASVNASQEFVASPNVAAKEVSNISNEKTQQSDEILQESKEDTPSTGLTSLIAAKSSHQRGVDAQEEAWLQATEKKLRAALLSYNLQAKVTGTRLTPNAALIRFMGSDRLRVQDIEAKRSALLTTHGLRVVNISPLPGEIVVSIERPKRQVVSLWDLWAKRELNVNAAGINTSFLLGLKEIDGEILYLNLGTPFADEGTHEPHTLIAGATGSGKSVLVQALALDIAATNSSKLAHIHLIDPKMGVDYTAIEKLPHIQGGVIVEQPRAIAVLEHLVMEMDRRYEAFRLSGARDLKTYNQKSTAAERLPVIFLIHDEFAEWMLIDSYRDAVASIVQRLGVKARAAGIHLFFAAQRPDVNVMPMQLRDNLGNRLILKVSSVGTSELALGEKGAESLLGMGHMAARLNSQIIFAQAPFLKDEDLELAVAAIIAQEQ